MKLPNKEPQRDLTELLGARSRDVLRGVGFENSTQRENVCMRHNNIAHRALSIKTYIYARYFYILRFYLLVLFQ